MVVEDGRTIPFDKAWGERGALDGSSRLKLQEEAANKQQTELKGCCEFCTGRLQGNCGVTQRMSGRLFGGEIMIFAYTSLEEEQFATMDLACKTIYSGTRFEKGR